MTICKPEWHFVFLYMTDDAFKQQFKELLEFQSANFEFFDHEIEQRDNNRTKENDDVN